MADLERRLIEAVSKRRQELGLSLRALAGLTGVSFSSLSRFERGEGTPEANTKVRLIQWLGPEAARDGFIFNDVAFVHFRAAKGISSDSVHSLLEAANSIMLHFDSEKLHSFNEGDGETGDDSAFAVSKEELEGKAERLRASLGLTAADPLDALNLNVDGVLKVLVRTATFLSEELKSYLIGKACAEWSAMSVPINLRDDQWVVLLNDCHAVERQRVTILEEYWHILLGHKLTKVAKIAETYGRTYDSAEEHDAYYLASASLLPRSAMISSVHQRLNSADIARRYGTSKELVDYRLKRLGLWHEHIGRGVHLSAK
jgi:transcriptional regulator with XRE-family HTH domain